MPRKRISAAKRNRLLKAARAVRKKAYCPYSDFAVGAGREWETFQPELHHHNANREPLLGSKRPYEV